MIRHLKYSSPIFVLFFYMLMMSCNQISTGNSTTFSDNSSRLKDTAQISLRVDTVLQFSVMVTAIFEDSKGNFWFGSHGDGLCRYDGKSYTYFTVNNGLPNGILREFAPGPDWSDVRKINGGNQAGEIQEDQNGDIWIKTMDHVCKFNGQTFVAVEPVSEGILSTKRTKSEWKKDLASLWFSSPDRLGVYRYDGEKLEFLSFPEPYASKRDGISEIYQDRDGNIWLGTMDNGTFRYDGQSLICINKKDEAGICRSVFQDNSGRIWITNNRFDLLYLEDGKLVNFIEEHGRKNKDESLREEFKNGFQSIEQDKNGHLWFGTFSDGLWRYDGENLTHFINVNGFKIETSKTVYKDNRGHTWFGLGQGSVYGFDGKSFYRFDGKVPLE